MKMEREKKKVLSKQLPTPYSITCGPLNPASLGCEFYELEGGEVATIFQAGKLHEGQLGIMHGGLTGSVLDELMGRSSLLYGRGLAERDADADMVTRYVTAEMTVKYKKPISIGDRISGFGRVYNKEGRRLYTSAELANEEGDIVATAEAVFVEIKVKKEELTDEISDDKKHQKISKNDPKEL